MYLKICDHTGLMLLFVLVPPTILSISKEKTINIRLQSQTTLTCVASGIPKPKIIWKKLGNSTILPSFNGTLKLTKLKSNDAGNYQCIAFNKVRNVSANVHLILQCKYVILFH